MPHTPFGNDLQWDVLAATGVSRRTATV